MGYRVVALLTKKLGALGSDISNKWINERRISEWQILSTGKQAEATLAQNLSALVSDKGKDQGYFPNFCELKQLWNH